MSADDPTETDPDLYHVIFENDRVRVLEYRDEPGDRTHPHRHPDSVMYALSGFRRRISDGDRHADVELPAGAVRWLPAQQHSGHNVGTAPTHTIFVELKEPARSAGTGTLGPEPAVGPG
jgi:quercetin dioxygenase-like cupin family protein